MVPYIKLNFDVLLLMSSHNW